MTEITGHRLINKERYRQVMEEGWTEDHDREHGAQTLGRAGLAYETENYFTWPWNHKYWKPRGVIKNLVRAGALYQAAADVADRDSYFSPEYYEDARDRVAGKIDEIITEISELSND